MNIRTTLLAAALAALALTASPGRADDDGNAADYTYTYEVDASAERTWELLTTKAGLESWAVPKAEVDMRPGGTIKTHYGEGEIGDENTIVHHIDAVVPHEMYAARTTPPANGGIMKLLAGTHSVTTFERLLPDRTRVVYRSFGWGEGKEWDQLAQVFDAGNSWTLQALRNVVPVRDRKTEVKETLAMLGRLRGHWLGTAPTPGEQEMQIYNHVENGPAGRALLMRGTMRVGEKTWLHSATQAWIAPGAIAIRFHEVSDDGGTANGTIRVEKSGEGDAETKLLVWDWNHVAPNAIRTRYRVEQEIASDDASYSMRVLRQDEDGDWQEMRVVTYTRVDSVPEGFTTDE